MKVYVVSLLGAVLAVSLFMGCADRTSENVSSKFDHLEIQGRLLTAVAGRLAVTDAEGNPISNASIQIGSRPAIPFAKNVVTTGADGLVDLPSDWVSTEPVTIDAPGFVRATYFGRRPEAAVFKLRRMNHATPIQLQGNTTGFGRLSGDGVLDVSLVYPAVPRSQVAMLELTQFISTESDSVKVYGQTLDFPSNLGVPAQTENYFLIIPVSLNKPLYRLNVPTFGNYRFSALHAQFDFKKTVDDIRSGKSFFDVINRFQFRSISMRDFGMQQASQTADFRLGENPLKPSLSVQAGRLPKGYAMLATSLVEDGGLCVVTDVKRLLQGETLKLATPVRSTGSQLLVRTLKKYDAKRTDFSGYDFEEMSSIALPANQSSADFLPILKPIVPRGRSITFTTPALSGGLTPGLTLVSLAKTEVFRSGILWLVKKNPVWDLYADGFVDEMALPSLAGAEPWAASGRYRWELTFAAGLAALSEIPQPNSIGNLTHATKTAIDFVVP